MKSKIFTTIPIMLIIVCIFSLNIFASNGDATNNAAGTNDYTDEASLKDDNVSYDEGTTKEAADNSNLEQGSGERGTPDNVFEMLFNKIKEYISEILCTLTFITSIIVAFAYKKGLVPALEGGVGAISRAVTKIKERGEESDKTAKDNYDNLARRVDEYENTLVALGERVDGLTHAIAPFGDELKNNKLIEELIVSQTNMLYEVFMASSLPAYQKDRVEAHFKKMMEDLGGEK